jgi:transcriptional regulator GlxA family with amidase domain
MLRCQHTLPIDLAPARVEKDFGPGAARAIARKLVVYHRRAGQSTRRKSGPAA